MDPHRVTLWGCFEAEAPPGSPAEAAGHLGLNENAATVAIHRLRKRFREIVPRAEIDQWQDVDPAVAGLPVGRDMDGRILTEAFDDEFLRQTKLSAIQTYEAEQLVVRRSGA